MELPWSTIDMDFMNLNQAAHGDREFGYIQTRLGVARKTVAGHVRLARSSPRASARGRARPLGRARAAPPAAGPLRRQHARRRRHRGRQGRGAAALRRLGQHLRRQRPGRRRRRGRRRRHRQARRRVRRHLRASRPSCCPAATGTSRCATAPGSSSACARSSTDGGFGAFTTNFEDLGGLRQLPGLAVQRLMADGYGFGGEGDWKTSVLLRAVKVMAAGLPGGTSFMEDYTYHLVPGRGEDPRRAHARGLPDDRRRPAVAGDPPAVASAAARTRSGCSSPPTPGAAVVVGLSDLGDRFRLTVNEIDVVEPDEPLPQPARRLRGLGAAARRCRPRPSPG